MTSGLQSAGLVFTLLNYFTLRKPRWGVREMAREVDRSPSVVQRAFNLLEEQGFLQQDPLSKTYSLGFRCLELGHIANVTLQFSQTVESCLRPVQEACGETIFIYRRRQDLSVCSYILESSQPIRFTATVGESLWLHQAPFTQVTLASLPEAERDDYLQRHGLTDDADLRAALTQFAALGYATSHGVWQSDTQGISVPLFNLQRQAVGSLCIAAASSRSTLLEYKPLLSQAANTLRPLFNQ